MSAWHVCHVQLPVYILYSLLFGVTGIFLQSVEYDRVIACVGVLFVQKNSLRKLYSARIIPFRGSWIEFATDINNVMYAYIDRKKKLPVTTLLRAIGLESDKDIIEIFGLAEEIKVNKTNLKNASPRRKGWL